MQQEFLPDNIDAVYSNSLTGGKLAAAGVAAKPSNDKMTSGNFLNEPTANIHILIKPTFRLFMIHYSCSERAVVGLSFGTDRAKLF